MTFIHYTDFFNKIFLFFDRIETVPQPAAGKMAAGNSASSKRPSIYKCARQRDETPDSGLTPPERPPAMLYSR